jgi:ferritin
VNFCSKSVNSGRAVLFCHHHGTSGVTGEMPATDESEGVGRWAAGYRDAMFAVGKVDAALAEMAPSRHNRSPTVSVVSRAPAGRHYHPIETEILRMSMSQVVKDAINHQINAELSASYQYLAMSAFCEKQNLRGFGRWLRLQSQEEYGHGMKLFDFMIARGCDVELQPLTAPTVSFSSLIEVFETVQRQEYEVSAQIDALYELAFREKAFAATVELQWFLTEQVEEEQSAREILSKIRMVQHDPASILDLDRDIGSRPAE